MTYLKTYHILRLTERFIKKLDRILVKKGYYNRKYVSRCFEIRNVWVEVTYPTSLGSIET